MPEYEFRHANAEEARLLRPLWQECFGDDAQFMACYEAQMFRPERVELALLNGEAVSMLTILPMTLCRDGKRMPGGCVYGVATRSDHRGRGLATQLLQAACRRLDHEVDCLAVVPDTPELFPYYSRTMLARTAFYVREIQLHAEQLTDRSPLNPQPAKAEDYLAARRDCLRGHTFLDWDRQAVYFQRQICRQEGGDLFLFSGIPGCAAVQRNERGALLVCELLAPEQCLLSCVSGLLACMNSREAAVRLPAWSGEMLGGSAEPFGMLAGPYLSDGEKAYLGFDFA